MAQRSNHQPAPSLQNLPTEIQHMFTPLHTTADSTLRSMPRTSKTGHAVYQPLLDQRMSILDSRNKFTVQEPLHGLSGAQCSVFYDDETEPYRTSSTTDDEAAAKAALREKHRAGISSVTFWLRPTESGANDPTATITALKEAVESYWRLDLPANARAVHVRQDVTDDELPYDGEYGSGMHSLVRALCTNKLVDYISSASTPYAFDSARAIDEVQLIPEWVFQPDGYEQPTKPTLLLQHVHGSTMQPDELDYQRSPHTDDYGQWGELQIAVYTRPSKSGDTPFKYATSNVTNPAEYSNQLDELCCYLAYLTRLADPEKTQFTLIGADRWDLPAFGIEDGTSFDKVADLVQEGVQKFFTLHRSGRRHLRDGSSDDESHTEGDSDVEMEDGEEMAPAYRFLTEAEGRKERLLPSCHGIIL